MKKFNYLLFSVLILFFYSCSSYVDDIKEIIEDKEVTYTVEHYLQTTQGGENYEKLEKDSKIYVGMSNSKTEAVANKYDGFYEGKFEQQTIKKDGSTVIKIYYDRKTISFTFKANNGYWGTDEVEKIVSGLFGTRVTQPENPYKIGYVFKNWSSEIPETFVSTNQTFSAEWIVSSETPYIVEHWQQNVDNDNYSKVTADTQILTGTTDDETAAVAKEYAGFSVKNFTQEKIAPDGSTIVRIKYDRNTITYTFKANGGNWDGNTEDITISGLYGAVISKPKDPIMQGYTFDSWGQTVPSSFDADSKTYIANWTANTNTKYKVQHYQQNVSGTGYSLKTTETKTGTTGMSTYAIAKQYTGFKVKDFSQDIIASDGSTIIRIEYDRINVTYTFKANGGNWNGSTADITKSGLYGAKVNMSENPKMTGYTFTEWDTTPPNTFGTTNKTYTATWTINTYVVKFYTDDNKVKVDDQNVIYNEKVVKPENPQRRDFNFVNWYKDKNLSELYNFDSPVTDNIIIYAKWDRTSYLTENGIVIEGKEIGKTDEITVLSSPTTIIGNDDEGVFIKGRTVILTPFKMCKYEVTQELYKAVTNGENPSKHDLLNNYPVENISWYDAIYFCNLLTDRVGGGLTKVYNISIQSYYSYTTEFGKKAGHITKATVTINENATGFRLPTEAEWEFAARGGDPSKEAWNYAYSGSNTKTDVAWNQGSLIPKIHTVGTKAPNSLGLYDMSGNVYEWCYDGYGDIGTGTVVNPIGSELTASRVLRGGDFITASHNCNVRSRYSAEQQKYSSSDENNITIYLGFRIVRSIPQN